MEIFFFDAPIAPPPAADKKSRKDATDYPLWLAQVTETIDIGATTIDDVKLRLFDNLSSPLPDAPFQARFNGKKVLGVADASGFILLEKVVLPDSIELKWRPKPADDDPTKDDTDEALLNFSLNVFVSVADHGGDEAVRGRLHNLGFDEGLELTENVRAFQEQYDLPVTGIPGDIQAQLIVVHDTASPRPFIPDTGSAGSDNGP